VTVGCAGFASNFFFLASVLKKRIGIRIASVSLVLGEINEPIFSLRFASSFWFHSEHGHTAWTCCMAMTCSMDMEH
jgi:hypothetical protein